MYGCEIWIIVTYNCYKQRRKYWKLWKRGAEDEHRESELKEKKI